MNPLLGSTRLRAGQWKVPYSRSRQLLGRELSFADRALASVLFDINRSVGAGLLGELELPEMPLQWEVALHNGFKSSAKLPSVTTGLDDHLAVSGRASLDPLGDWGEEGISDLAWHKAAAIRIGSGFAISTMDTDRGTEASSLFSVDSGEAFQSLLPGEFTTSLFSLDIGVRRRGLSVFSEYYLRTTDDFTEVVLPRLFDHGFVVQSGYFVVRERLELLARWSRASGNSAISQAMRVGHSERNFSSDSRVKHSSRRFATCSLNKLNHVIDRIGVFEARNSGQKCARWRCKIDCTILARRKPKTKPDPSEAFQYQLRLSSPTCPERPESLLAAESIVIKPFRQIAEAT